MSFDLNGKNNISFSSILKKHFAGNKLNSDNRLVERLVVKLAESQRKILEFVRMEPYITIKELSQKIGISTTAVDKNIVLLKKKGMLKRIGPDKGGRWAETKRKKG
ncbi:MAG: HTH domain-containing protein [bacterium]